LAAAGRGAGAATAPALGPRPDRALLATREGIGASPLVAGAAVGSRVNGGGPSGAECTSAATAPAVEAGAAGGAGGPIAMAGIAGRERGAPPISIERVTTTAGGAGLGGGGDGRTGAGGCAGVGPRCTVARVLDDAGTFVPGESGFGAPSFGDFEKRLIAFVATIPVSRSRSMPKCALVLVGRVHIRATRARCPPPVAYCLP
jgi:hypothetical protein